MAICCSAPTACSWCRPAARSACGATTNCPTWAAPPSGSISQAPSPRKSKSSWCSVNSLMTLIDIATDDLINRFPVWVVSLKEHWANDWVVQENPRRLFCDQLQLGCAPAGSSAQLSMRYGRGLVQDQKTFQSHLAGDYLNQWVKI